MLLDAVAYALAVVLVATTRAIHLAERIRRRLP